MPRKLTRFTRGYNVNGHMLENTNKPRPQLSIETLLEHVGKRLTEIHEQGGRRLEHPYFFVNVVDPVHGTVPSYFATEAERLELDKRLRALGFTVQNLPEASLRRSTGVITVVTW